MALPMQNPMQQQNGGQALPPYLQQRTPLPKPGMPMPGSPTQTGIGKAATQPVVTPKPSAPGDTMATGQGMMNVKAQQPPPGGLNVNTGQGDQANPYGQGLAGLYNFYKSDLQNQAKQATANSVADASARGVYYGSPLTGSEADINTQYLRGLGQLQAGMYGNEQANQLARLGLATNLFSTGGMNAPPGGQMDPQTWQMIGQMFGGATGQGAPSGQRTGPQITPAGQPNQQFGNQTQTGPGQGYGNQTQGMGAAPQITPQQKKQYGLPY